MLKVEKHLQYLKAALTAYAMPYAIGDKPQTTIYKIWPNGHVKLLPRRTAAARALKCSKMLPDAPKCS